MRKILMMAGAAMMMAAPAFAHSVVLGGTGAIGGTSVSGGKTSGHSSSTALTIGGAETSYHEGGSGSGAGVDGQTVEGSYSTGSSKGDASYSAGSLEGGASGGYGSYNGNENGQGW